MAHQASFPKSMCWLTNTDCILQDLLCANQAFLVGIAFEQVRAYHRFAVCSQCVAINAEIARTKGPETWALWQKCKELHTNDVNKKHISLFVSATLCNSTNYANEVFCCLYVMIRLWWSVRAIITEFKDP